MSVQTPQILNQANHTQGQYSSILTVETALQQPAWQEAFNSRVILMARDHRQLAHIQINPPELGPVEIRMSLNAEQTHVQFISQHAVVREAIEDAFPRLRDMMEASGLTLGDVEVSDQTGRELQSFQDSDSGFTENGDIEVSESITTEKSTQRHALQTRLIDHFV